MNESYQPPDGSAGASPSQSRLPRRSHPKHGVRDSVSVPTIVFVTVCTKNRAPWLAQAEVHELLVDVWKDSTAWLVGRYVLMPDHLHLFTSPGEQDLPLENWVRFWKSGFTKRSRHPDRAWQVDHWDRRLRADESYAAKWEYVLDNPVRAKLVTKREDWPYQGELNEFRWH